MEHNEQIGRKRPAQGVHIELGQPTIVFLTVCSKDRKPWIANPLIHQLLRSAWTSADAWLVGHYVLMPDHVHLFCAPKNLDFSLESWVTFWKRQFRRLHGNPEWTWQAHSFHRRLRREEDYAEKWIYVRSNPSRKGLVCRAEEWPYFGMMNVLRW